MSHPWKAQPYYMYRDPRTTAPVPAPMGNFGVREALARDVQGFGAYTRGSFGAKSPWNVPHYIAAQPTGVDGFGDTDALGQCESYEGVKAWVRKNVVDRAFAEMPSQVKDVVGNLADKLATKITDRIKSASESAQDIQAKAGEIAKESLKAILPSDPLGMLDFVIDMGLPILLKYFVNVPRVCAPKPAPAPADTWQPPEILPIQTPQQITPQQLYEIQKRLAAQVAMVAPGSAIERAIRAPTGLRLLPKPTPTTTTTVPTTPAKGISPVVIGAAALAALMLLK